MYYISRVFTPNGNWTAGIEGPACDYKGNLYAVNFEYDGTIGKVTPDGRETIYLNLPGDSVANGIRFNAKREMIIADYTCHNLYKVDPDTKEISIYAHNPAWHQPNDLAIAQNGLVYISDPDWPALKGRIWLVRPDGSMQILDDEMGTTNGIEVGYDECTLYVNESEQRRIWAYDIKNDGTLENKRLFISFKDYGMDGMRCDIQGNLYVTRYHKGTVLKLNPEGQPLLEVYLHGKRCSNICFGGEDGCTCYVTMADTGCVETFRCDCPGREWMLYRKWSVC